MARKGFCRQRVHSVYNLAWFCLKICGVHAVVLSCEHETLNQQRALCTSLRALLKLVWEQVEETRSPAEVSEVYSVPMSRTLAARTAQTEYLGVLKEIDKILLIFDEFMKTRGQVQVNQRAVTYVQPLLKPRSSAEQ